MLLLFFTTWNSGCKSGYFVLIFETSSSLKLCTLFKDDKTCTYTCSMFVVLIFIVFLEISKWLFCGLLNHGHQLIT